ncbi:MAG: type II toxin-antitoxin system VapC family toxin [Parvularculaceae bacterium]
MTLVSDASVVLAAFVPDESEPASEALLAEIVQGGALVPSVFWNEIRNAVLSIERRRRLTRMEADLCLASLRALPLRVAPDRSDAEILHIARECRLTAYDAAYVALALHEKLPLATLDAEIIASAGSVGLAIWVPSAKGQDNDIPTG